MEPEALAASEEHARLVDRVLDTGKAAVLAPRSRLDEATGAGNPTELLLLTVPLQSGGEKLAAVEVYQRPDCSPSAHAGYLRFLQRTCKSAAEFFQRRRLESLRRLHQEGMEIDRFARAVHGEDARGRAAHVIVNEGRQVLGADRVSVATVRRGKMRVEAVSGQSSFDRRANLVRRMESLAQSVAETGEPLFFPNNQADESTGTPAGLREYAKESKSAAIACVPLLDQENDPVGVLICDWFERETVDVPARRRLNRISGHAALAVANARTGAWGLSWWSSFDGDPARRVLKTAIKLFLMSAVLLGLTCLFTQTPAEFTLHARGRLQPQERRDVFAQVDGEVLDVFVKHGETVEPGRLLIELRNEQLEQRRQEILGKRRELETAIEGMQAERLAGGRMSAEDRNRLSSRLETQQRSLASLLEEDRLLKQRLGRMKIVSPAKGRITTWEVDRLLGSSRPVQRGQRLMSVENLDGDWSLEIDLDEDRLGRLAAAQEQLGSDL
ncbi:MAG: GAF domain-containing protein, partial [Planctomycetales bacterium]